MAAAVTRLGTPPTRALPPPSTLPGPMGAATGAEAGAGGQVVLPMVRGCGPCRGDGGALQVSWNLEDRVTRHVEGGSGCGMDPGQGRGSPTEAHCVLQAPARTHPQLLRLNRRRGRSPAELGQVTGTPQPGEKKAGGGRSGAGVGDPQLPPGLPQDTTLRLSVQVPAWDSWGCGCGSGGGTADAP